MNARPDDGCVFVLWLLNGCWYVGYASTLARLPIEIEKHKRGGPSAAKWIRLHPFAGVAQVLYNVPVTVEVQKTAQLAEQYGWSCVRGGGHTAVDPAYLRLPRPLQATYHDEVVDSCDGIGHLIKTEDCCRTCCKGNYTTFVPSKGCPIHGRIWPVNEVTCTGCVPCIRLSI